MGFFLLLFFCFLVEKRILPNQADSLCFLSSTPPVHRGKIMHRSPVSSCFLLDRRKQMGTSEFFDLKAILNPVYACLTPWAVCSWSLWARGSFLALLPLVSHCLTPSKMKILKEPLGLLHTPPDCANSSILREKKWSVELPAALWQQQSKTWDPGSALFLFWLGPCSLPWVSLGKGWVRIQQDGGQQSQGAGPHLSYAGALVSDLQFPKMWDNKFLRFKPPGLWYFVTAAWVD